MTVIPLEKMFKDKAFRDGVIERIDDGIYRINASVSLYDSSVLAHLGYATVIVTDKFITVAELFFPPEIKAIERREAKLIEIYAVNIDKACEFMEKISNEKKIPLAKTPIWWCSEDIAIIESDEDEEWW